MLRRLLFLCAVANIALAQAASQPSAVGGQKHPFTFEAMMALKRIGDPQVSPDGRWVMLSAVEVNLDENTVKSDLGMVAAAGGDSRQITNGQAGEERGRYSPDGRSILYTSSAVGG